MGLREKGAQFLTKPQGSGFGAKRLKENFWGSEGKPFLWESSPLLMVAK